MSSKKEPCPDCKMEESEGDMYHGEGCPREGTKGQIGPPWLPGPWEPW